jgi:NADH:ubiquinone oxidoreductase subunit 3 (subunit A)
MPANGWITGVILAPPVAFTIYLVLSIGLSFLGRYLAGPEQPSTLKSSIYASGEETPSLTSAPGYRPFFLFALFFAILHLGVLMLGSGELNWMAGAYLVVLFLALVALILG